MAKYTVVYTEEIEGGFSGKCLELPGAISQGETPRITNIGNALSSNLDKMTEQEQHMGHEIHTGIGLGVMGFAVGFAKG